MEKLDLHMHSIYSDDGELSVGELMERCAQARLTQMAITDHNSVRGTAQSLALGAQMDMEAIAGVELDCVCDGRNLHLLGYHFDYSRAIFGEIEENILAQERSIAAQKLELIQRETGIPFSSEEMLAAAGENILSGELIAELLLAREDAAKYTLLLPYLPGGARSDNPYVNFYWDYFSQGKAAYLPLEYMSLEEAIALLHDAGGIAVLAHPGQSLPGDTPLLRRIINCGIDGIEAYSSYHDRIAAGYYQLVAQENKLLITCGSDFHGKTKPSIPLGGHHAEKFMGSIAAGLRGAGVLR